MKYYSTKKSIFLFLALLILCSFNAFSQNVYLSFKDGSKIKSEGIETTPKRTYQSVKSCDVEIGYTFSGAYVAEKNVEKSTYNFLHINGFGKMNKVGAPALPAFNDIIAIPRGSKANIVILDTEYFEYDGFMIHPTLEPAIDTEGFPSPEFKKDETIYTSNEFFPKNVVEIVSINLNRGTGLANTQIRPVQFNPVTGKLRVYTKVEYRLEISGGEGNFNYISQENTLHYTNTLKRSVINSDCIPDGLNSENQKKNKSGAKNYIIITHSQYISQANELANWKRQLGYSVEVISKSSWAAADVKSEVHSRYSSWTPKPDYFVVIGDHDGSYAVPGEIHTDPNYGDNFATDLYVACMDGGSDHFPDMAHGRISVSSSTEASVVINKIINYEKNPISDASFYQNLLNCAQWQDTDDDDGYADRRFCHTSEDIRDYLQDNHAYTSTRIYYRETGAGTADVSNLRYNNGYYSDGQLLPAELRDASFNWSGGETEITTEFDAGKFLVFHRDHGYSGGIGWAHPYYTTTSMNSLNNGDKLPVVFSINCHTGEFQLSNCFAEKLLRMENKGAVGVVGAAYYSYSGYNDAISEGMIDAIWPDPGLYPNFGSAGTGGTYTIGAGNDIYTMGDVVNQGLNAMVQNFGDNTYSFELFHYFGDPAMKIWTANPHDNIITATHNTNIDCAGSSLSITGSTPEATATLVYNDELVAHVVLDASGNGTLSYTMPEPASEAVLTVSKYNFNPYVDTLAVTGSCSFPPTVVTHDATSVLETSADLNGEITNDYGSTVIESGFVYGTSIDPEIGGTGVAQVQTSPVVTTGTFSESISGLSAITTYYYRPYAINANGTNYGDNKSFTTLCGVVNSFPYLQDFDSFTLSSGPSCMGVEFSEQECWANDNTDDQTDWSPYSGATASSNTGPSDDITGGGNYLYVETSGSCNNLFAYLETPVFDFSGTEIYELSFYYHMYGSSMGSLQIDLYYNGTWHNAINTNWNGISATSISGDQGAVWNFATVDLSQAQGYPDVKIRFSATTGTDYTSDIAIDNVEITEVIPLAYQSSTAIQNIEDTYKGEINKEILEIQFETSGNAGSLPLRQLTFNTTGTDNIADILNAKLYYTDTTSVFNTDNQFGGTIENPNGTFNITDSIDLIAGTNYFWLTYDISSSATIGNIVDAQFTELIIGGNTETPIVTNPSGAVSIVTASELNVSTESLSATITACNDSVTHQFDIENTGGKDLIVELLINGKSDTFDSLSAGEIINTYSNFSVNNTGMVWIGDYLYSIDYGNQLLHKYDHSTQQLVNSYTIHSSPLGIAFDGDNLWIGSGGGTIYEYDLSGNASGNSINLPFSDYPALTWNGEYFVASPLFTHNSDIYLVAQDGSTVETFSGYIGSSYQFTWSEVGAENHIWVNDYQNGMIRYIELSGETIQELNSFLFTDNTSAYSLSHDGTDIWYADFDGPLYQVNDGYSNVSWLNLSINNDTISSGVTTQVDVEFNAKGLNSGVYGATIHINSNDPVNSFDTITCILTVDGSPQIDVSPTSFDFGDVFVNGTNEDTFAIFNTGCDTLFVTNIASAEAAYTVDNTNLEIIPGESAEVVITFSPTSVGTVNSILTVYNNDIDATINLTGNGIPAPNFSLSTLTLNATVTECNDSITIPMDVINSGGGDLIFNIDGESSGTIELLALTYGVDYSEEYQNAIDAINQHFTDYNLTEVYTTDPSVLEASLSGKDVLLICEQENGSTGVFSDFASALQDYVNQGGSVIFCGTSNNQHLLNTGLFTGTSGGNTSSGSLDVLNTEHPITDGLGSTISALNATYYLNITNSDAVRLVEYNSSYDIVTYREIGTGKVIFVAFDFYAYDDNAAKLIANSVQWSGQGSIPSWINLSAYNDTVVGGSSQSIDVEFNSKNLESGVYSTNIIVNSNDPVNTADTISCTFTVDGNPQAEVSSYSYDFGEVYVNGLKSDTVVISNLGCDTLFITNITTSLAVYNADKTLFELLPGESEDVIITFMPTLEEVYSGNLIIYNNDALVTINLTGTGIASPVLSLDTHYLDAEVTLCNDSITKQFTIYNIGDGDLAYNIDMDEGFSEGFESGLGNWAWTGTWGTTTNSYEGSFALTESPSGNYLNNMNQYIELAEPLVVENQYSCDLSYWLDRQMESCCDYIKVQISVNEGTWQTLESVNGSVSWVQRNFDLSGYVNNGDLLKVRFEFTSDGSVTSEGVSIDNIYISGVSGPWLTLSSYSGTVSSGGSQVIDVKFNAKNLNSGYYSKELIISANDPVNVTDTISCMFNVNYVPSISVSTTEVDFGSVIANDDTYIATLTISNTGCDSLEISNITSSYSVYSVNQTSFVIYSGESREITIYFTPQYEGTYLGELKIYSNDPNAGEYLVALKGTGVCENIIEEQPQPIEVNVGEEAVFSISAPGATYYQWQKNGIDISGEVSSTCTIQSVTSSDAGGYSCLVGSSCGEITSEIANLSLTTGLEELSKFGIEIYPNPSDGIFTVEYNNYYQEIEVVIYSLNGGVIYNDKHISTKNEIDISDKAKGMYIIRFNFDNNSIISNIVIK